ncbi:MAG TPA: sugar phosphate isomerase/epimerase [Chthoniobacterales bacterium]|nr:sugar phosphate isomerase/epimerase [Chthoniobacterales bacterium]
MKLATAPVNWNNADVTDYRPWVPYPALLDEMVAAGYHATEWGMNMERDAAKLLADLQQRNLQILGGFVGLGLRNREKRDKEIARALEIGRFFQSVGAPYLIAADSGDDRRRGEAGHVDPNGALTKEQWQSLATGLNDLARELAPLGIKVVFHNHVGTYVETEAETGRLLEETDPALVSWCLDCGHLAYGGGDNLRALEKYGNRVGYVHIKDVDGQVLQKSRENGWSFGQALKSYIFAPLGEGIARVPEVIDSLRQAGYAGWVVIEQDTTPDDPTQVADRNRHYLEPLIK